MDPERAVVVEDAVSGVAAGHAGGFGLVVGVDRGVGADQLTDGGRRRRRLRPRRAGGGLDARRARGHPDAPPRPARPGPVPGPGLGADRDRLLRRGPRRDRDALRRGQRLPRHARQRRGGRETYAHGTFINGFHETYPIRHAEEAFGFAKVGQTIVNVPDNKTVKLYVDDEPLLLPVADLEHYDRTLDFRDGVLRRDLVWRTPAGKRVQVTSRRMVSFTQRHLAIMTFEVTMLDDSAPVVISSQTLNRQDGRDEYHVRSAAMGEGSLADPRKAEGFHERVLEPQTHCGRRHRG